MACNRMPDAVTAAPVQASDLALRDLDGAPVQRPRRPDAAEDAADFFGRGPEQTMLQEKKLFTALMTQIGTAYRAQKY